MSLCRLGLSNAWVIPSGTISKYSTFGLPDSRTTKGNAVCSAESSIMQTKTCTVGLLHRCTIAPLGICIGA